LHCTRKVRENRAWTAKRLTRLGFRVLPSKTNFLFAESGDFPAGDLYRKLKERGVLVRWFDQDRIRDFYRITIGAKSQMERLIGEIESLLREGRT
jgi:histidinol-phosphate aminotransferase